MGATNPEDAKEGTVRALYGSSIERNAIHGSDSPENAEKELLFFFSRAELIACGAISEELYDGAHAIAQRLFAEGTRFAEKQGLILVDTKYEMGLDAKGEIVVIDEIHTPDSSRYWQLDSYESALAEGRSPAAIDKEYVRLWLGEQGYKGDGTPPELPIEVRVEAATRYIRAFEQVSGRAFDANLEPPVPRIRRNLGLE